ncbi:MAG: signal peptidase II [Acidimicrobiia bacterium]
MSAVPGQARRPRLVPALRSRPLALIGAVGSAVLAVDQLTKWWALRALADRDIDLVWTLRLHLTYNTGSAFSLGSGSGSIIAVLAIVIVGVTVWMGRNAPSGAAALAMGLLVGGAVGNLADRAFRSGEGFLGGAVVDFVDLQWWPVFNVADIAVTLGALALLAFSGRRGTGAAG